MDKLIILLYEIKKCKKKNKYLKRKEEYVKKQILTYSEERKGVESRPCEM